MCRVALLCAGSLLALPLWAGLDNDKEAQQPPKLNPSKPPGPAPKGMVWIPGGEFYMGIDEKQLPAENDGSNALVDALKIKRIYVDGFWMDATEVTNEQFAAFVKATKHFTTAERPPDPKDFPDLPKELILKDPFSVCFKQPPPDKRVNLENREWWHAVKGACWKHPEGPGSDLKGREKHPAVHISWEDAVAYCKWAKKRLPTEAEWEFAARGGLDRKRYCWGDELKPKGKWQCNIWQGIFPNKNTKEDGFIGTAPVASFPANGYGLRDMAGNVWEWCHDYYDEDYYDNPKRVLRNPKGPDRSRDKADPNLPKQVQRGGSFLCADNYCCRYLPGARGKGERRGSWSHVGFRCVKDR